MGRKKSLHAMVVSSPEEVARLDAMLCAEHYLKDHAPVGDFRRQVIVQHDQWVGLLAWGACSDALQDRDEWIGWTAPMRAQRRKRLVQNCRFLVPKAARRPNLASQVLGCAVAALPQQWHVQFGYSPVLAETCTDIELFAGTCYKASGWLPVVVAIQSEKEGDGEHCELEVGKRSLADHAPILDGALVRSDALHTQKPNAMNVTDAGGDYLFQVRDNRPKLRQLAAAKAAATPFLPAMRKKRPAVPACAFN